MLLHSLSLLSVSFLHSLPFVLSQSPQLPLSFDTPVTLTGSNSSAPQVFSLPSSSSQVTISLALCAAASSSPLRVFVTNSSSSSQPVVPGPDGGPDVFEVTIDSLGLGSLTLDLPTGDVAEGVLAVYGGTTSDSLEVAVSQGAVEPLHAPLTDLPFFGDSTANGALLYAPPFLPPAPAPKPTYPNYTLPQANTTPPDPPSSTPNFTLFLAPLDAGLTTLVPQTACAIRARVTGDPNVALSAEVLKEQLWLRDERSGWRREWLVGRLEPLTNYSVYAIQDGTRLSGPMYFTTKSASFSCQLVHALPYCPTTAYSVPLPRLPSDALAYDASNLPENLTTPLLAYLTNFTTSLTTVACGRDLYSPLQTCADCQTAYRNWLCTTSLPRCGEFPSSVLQQQQQQQQQRRQQGALALPPLPPPALQPQPSGTPSRNPALGNATADYAVLLPCIETCYAADRACPVFLGFRCPRPATAGSSYGIGFIDSNDGDVPNGGVPGVAQDQWGNLFCNGS